MLAQAARNMDLGENLPFVPPESSHPLKRRAVVIPAVGKSTVTFLFIERLGTTSADFCDVHLDRRGSVVRLSDASVRVYVPSIVGSVGATVDVEFAQGRIEHHLHRMRAALIESQKFLKLDVFDDAGNGTEYLPGGREPHLDISRPRKDDRVADHVIRKVAQVREVELGAPGRLRYLEPVAQQRMDGSAQSDPACRFVFPPMTVRLERIGRQLDATRVRIEPLPIDLGTERIQSTERSQQRRPLAVLTPQRTQRRACGRLFVQALGDVASQDRMRAEDRKSTRLNSSHGY